MFTFKTACLVTAAIFIPMSLLVLLFADTWVEFYIVSAAQWPVSADNFRFIAALNLTVGTLLLALTFGDLNSNGQFAVACAMVACIGVLTGVHVYVLATNDAAEPQWTRTLRVDAVSFAAITVYWLITAVRIRRRR